MPPFRMVRPRRAWTPPKPKPPVYRGPKLLPAPPRGKRGRAAAAAATPSFNPLTSWTTDPVHGVWASDPLWTPPADGGAVSSWRNGGSVGGDLVQATGAKQPTYRASTAAFNNQPTVQGDGIDDYLAVNFAPYYIQPYYIVAAMSKGKAANVAETIFSDHTGGAHEVASYTGTGASTWRMKASTELTGGTADTNPHLLTYTFNGASSSLFVDGTSTITGNAGANPLLALELFALANGYGLFSSGHIAFFLIFTTNPTALPEWATFKAWVTSTYGITVA